MNESTARTLHPKWDALLLVCKACGKRGDAPKKLKPKLVANELRNAGKKAGLRSRVALTSCLGLCPKGAIAVVASGPHVGAEPVAVAIASPQALAGCAASLGIQPIE